MLKNSLAALLAAAVLTVSFNPVRSSAQSKPEPTASPAPQATLPPYQSVPPVRVLGIIRRVFRSHRPPPPYETYTMIRTQYTNYAPEPGASPYPDPLGSYTTHYWVRNVDRAALTRRIYRDDAEGQAVFDRPALNEATDPGPPTADVFAPAPIHQHIDPTSYVPTPEPTSEPLKTIGSVVAIGESDYDVPQMTVEKNLLHLVLKPRRDPERNVLREIWVDKKSYELRRIIAHDRLFTGDQGIFPVTFTYTLGYLSGQLVVTHLHGIVGARTESNGVQTVYGGDGAIVDFDFQDITFPSSLPGWYFNPREYGQHVPDVPI
ncbi:MAG TPA: hypothetical protein VFO29_10620 [Candidatus Rubrimentiphilum sp.]|nr:hypothetical protein [Candidatus Rubrimentiphilum sp.]